MKKSLLKYVMLVMVFAGCRKENQHLPDPGQLQQTTFASGLKNPIGMAIDNKGRIWVTENGNGKNDARVDVVTADGSVYPAITGFTSVFSPENGGEVVGLTHLVFKDNKLYILNGVDGYLYIADISGFKPGTSTLSASSLLSEDIATFVKSKNLTDPLNSDPYNLTFGPHNDLYIADAGANAIIKRNSSTGELSVFSVVPNINATTESVPTGIVYDGSKFLVSALSGFPFADGSTNIYKIDLSGNASIYKTGFTALTDIVLAPGNQPLVLQYATFAFNPPTNVGFQPASGNVLDENANVLVQGLSLPTSIQRQGAKTYYVLSHSLGTIEKLSY